MTNAIQVVLFALGGVLIELTGAPTMMDNARAIHAVRERHRVLLRLPHGPR